MLKHLSNSANYSLHQLYDVLDQTNDTQFSQPLSILFQSSIGMHVRHIIEFYQCMILGVATGSIHYDGRERNHKIETDIDYAKECILTCIHHISEIEISNDLCLITSQDLSNESFRIPTNVYRELTYLIEHTIHHMAIIKMAYSETYPLVKLPADFGIAYSTLKYQKSCAQ